MSSDGDDGTQRRSGACMACVGIVPAPCDCLSDVSNDECGAQNEKGLRRETQALEFFGGGTGIEPVTPAV